MKNKSFNDFDKYTEIFLAKCFFESEVKRSEDVGCVLYTVRHKNDSYTSNDSDEAVLVDDSIGYSDSPHEVVSLFHTLLSYLKVFIVMITFIIRKISIFQAKKQRKIIINISKPPFHYFHPKDLMENLNLEFEDNIELTFFINSKHVESLTEYCKFIESSLDLKDITLMVMFDSSIKDNKNSNYCFDLFNKKMIKI